MAIAPVALWGPVLLSTSNAQLTPTIPTGNKLIVRNASFANNTAGAVTVNVWLVRVGQSVGDSSLISPSILLPAEGNGDNVRVVPELANVVLNAGDAIWAVASANTAVTTTGSGLSYP